MADTIRIIGSNSFEISGFRRRPESCSILGSMQREKALSAVLVGAPLTILIAAYLWLAWDVRQVSVWNEIVHENGRYTLWETVSYGRHFLREISVVAIYALICVGAFKAYGPRRVPRREFLFLRRPAWILAVLLVVTTVVITVGRVGAQIAALDLFQAYLRDDQPSFGIHWQAHQLSSLVFLCAAIVLAAMMARIVDGDSPSVRPRERNLWLGGSLVTMVLMTVIWGLDWRTVADPRIVGHQAREAITHSLLTLPICMGLLMALSTDDLRQGGQSAAVRSSPSRGEGTTSAIVGALLLIYIGVFTLASDAVGAAHPNGRLSSLVAAHFFEHVLDYALAASLCAGLFLTLMNRSGEES